MKIIALSDLHGYLPENIEPCDVVAIAGDIIDLFTQRDYHGSHDWFRGVFLDWCHTLPCKRVIICAGNHDFYLSGLLGECKFREDISDRYLGNKVIYLEDESYEYNGKLFYGFPWVSELPFWAFSTDNVTLDVKNKLYKNIPDNTDVLICHATPALGTLTFAQYTDVRLAKRIAEIRPPVVICGHIHELRYESAHVVWENKTTTNIHNASVKDDYYKLIDMSFEKIII